MITNKANINLQRVPYLFDMYFFNEATIAIDTIADAVEEKITQKIDKDQYELFCRHKFKKPLVDIYALFNPFNEATKAFYPFIPFLKKHLQKGDVILDIGNRNGWTSALLSGLFPEQKIISFWEGDTDVLGYNGFAYWFAHHDYPSNVTVAFGDFKKNLPFEDKSVALVVGYDLLHRQLRSDLIPELLRISNDDGIILFPHVHLANAEPSPYFKRGGDLIHGNDYNKFFKKAIPQHKKGFVFSEPDLFRKSNNPNLSIQSDPNTSDYNGLVALSNSDLDLEKQLTFFDYFDYFLLEEGFLVPNQLFEIDFKGQMALRTDVLENEIKKLLDNHPVYIDKIKNTIGYALSDIELKILYWAKKNRSVDFIKNKLNLERNDFQELIIKLQKLDILQILPLNAHHAQMQHFLSTQYFIENPEKNHLQSLWQRAVASFPKNVYALDRSDNTFYTFQEFDEIVKCITETLVQKGLKKGDKIVLDAEIHFESMGLFWACMNLGIIYIPINVQIPPSVFSDLVSQYEPKLVFLYQNVGLEATYQAQTIFFDKEDEETDAQKLYFSEWLTESNNDSILPNISENDLGVILHTSGSSGLPKGVMLSQGQLFQSAVNMVTHFQWGEKDKYLSIGHLDSMSGLRNACIVTAEAGAACIIPNFEEKNNMNELLDGIYESDTTVLVASPSLLNQLLNKNNVRNRMAKVRCILSTGSTLTTHLKQTFFEKTQKKIYNYYGLTETTGFCIGEPLSSDNLEGNFIGLPVDCIAQVVDSDKNKVKTDEIGELRLYSSNISNSYWHSRHIVKPKNDDWFYTGDLVKQNTEGGFELMGRKTDFIKTAQSEIVFLNNIDESLSPLNFINDVATISFFQNESEKIAVFLTINKEISTEINIVEAVKKQIDNALGPHKTPNMIKVVAEIPRSKNGKLIKTELEQYL